MSITDELREYATVRWEPWAEARDRLLKMCDHIDAEHDEWVADRDANWVTLPLAADGEAIHIGDVMESDSGETFKVCRLQLFDSGWAIDGGKFAQGEIRHHHVPTVEDILREFYVYAERGKEHHREDVDDAVLAEYAAKLRLAGEE